MALFGTFAAWYSADAQNKDAKIELYTPHHIPQVERFINNVKLNSMWQPHLRWPFPGHHTHGAAHPLAILLAHQLAQVNLSGVFALRCTHAPESLVLPDCSFAAAYCKVSIEGEAKCMEPGVRGKTLTCAGKHRHVTEFSDMGA